MQKSLHTMTQASGPTPIPAVQGPPEHRLPPIVGYLTVLLDQRWFITLVVAASLLCGAGYYGLAARTYRADALVQVDEQDKNVFGNLQALSELQPRSRADTEIEILRSRTLLGSVVSELGLDVVASPRYLPLIGEPLSRWNGDDELSPAVLGLDAFAWGGERLDVTRLDVPAAFEGKKLRLVAMSDGKYDVHGPRGLVLHGEIGKAASANLAGRGGGPVEIFVADLAARPGTEFELSKLAQSKVVERLQEELSIFEKGRSTGVIRIALEGRDPARIRATLNAIARTYLRQNVEQKSAEAEKTLAFIDEQLPVLKGNVDAAEAALAQYRAKKGATVDLSLETRALLERAAEVEKRATELALTRAELQQRFTPSHPTIVAVRQKEQSLQDERASIEGKIKVLPESEMQSVRLQRDLKVANELYVLLLNRAQELRVMKSGTVGNVRILDPAVTPTEPATPRPLPTLALSLALGLCFGVALAIVRSSLNVNVDDPEEIERETGLSVYASIPHSESEDDSGARFDRTSSAPRSLLAAAEPHDMAIESLRSLRTSIQFALSGAQPSRRGNVIALLGPSPGVGKSFVTANLGHVLASLGRRVVMVDTDMRKGRLHQYFTRQKSPGLAEVIYGNAKLDDAVQPTSLPNLSVLPMGKAPPNPAELLSSAQFTEIVDTLAARFDLVLLDTPPILAVADAGVVASVASLRLLVVRAGHHSMREITASVKRLSQNGVATNAIIMNDVQGRSGRYGYHYRYQ